MAKYDNSASWAQEDLIEATVDPNVSMSSVQSEQVPTMTVATIVGVAVVLLAAIAAVFLLGLLIDWRQQKILDKKMNNAKRMKSRRVNTHPEDDSASIANNMEEPGLSVPPAETLRTIP